MLDDAHRRASATPSSARHIRPGDDLWVRVDPRRLVRRPAEVAKRRLGCTFFDFLSAIDWLPSPFGRDEDAEVDLPVPAPPPEPAPIVPGYAGGDTRFQVLARLLQHRRRALRRHLKADVPDDDLRIATWIPAFAGANWHERETCEMFGITFDGHPDLRNSTCPASSRATRCARTSRCWPAW